MKHTAALLFGLALLAAPALAAGPNRSFPYASGDVVYVAYSQKYTDPNGTNNLPSGPEYVVNLGSYTQFVNASNRVNLPDVSAADFTGVLGAAPKNVYIAIFGLERPSTKDGMITQNGAKNDFDLTSSSILGAAQQTDVFGGGIAPYNDRAVPSSNPKAAGFSGPVVGSYQLTLNGDGNNPGQLGGQLAWSVEAPWSNPSGVQLGARKVRLYLNENNPYTGLFNRRLLGYFQINTDGTVYYEPDQDGDFVPSEIDNCPNVANASQLNADGDAYGAACDCNDSNNTVWAIPTEVSGLGFTGASRTNLGWLPVADQGGSVAVVYDVYRENSPLSGATVYDCFQGNLAGTSAIDTAIPARGTSFNYLVAGQNACGQDLGKSTSGASRTGNPCP